jgi:hypothetical protein
MVDSAGLEVLKVPTGTTRLTVVDPDDLRSNRAERVLISSVSAQCGVRVSV